IALNPNAFSTSCIPEEVFFFFNTSVLDGAITYECRKCPSKPKQAWKTGYSNLRKAPCHLCGPGLLGYVCAIQERANEPSRL
ncbi:hypothetical protein JG687_00016411, partial [Phytophthora cactorum]